MQDDLKDLAEKELGWKQKLAAYVLWQWAKEHGVDFIGQIIAQFFARKGWQTSALGVPLLMLAGYVQFVCATDASTGGWIDPHCATLVKIGMSVSALGHFLAPGFTAGLSQNAP